MQLEGRVCLSTTSMSCVAEWLVHALPNLAARPANPRSPLPSSIEHYHLLASPTLLYLADWHQSGFQLHRLPDPSLRTPAPIARGWLAHIRRAHTDSGRCAAQPCCIRVSQQPQRVPIFRIAVRPLRGAVFPVELRACMRLTRGVHERRESRVTDLTARLI